MVDPTKSDLLDQATNDSQDEDEDEEEEDETME